MFIQSENHFRSRFQINKDIQKESGYAPWRLPLMRIRLSVFTKKARYISAPSIPIFHNWTSFAFTVQSNVFRCVFFLPDHSSVAR